jgi:RNA polymerase sigma factor (sigma-70 family)
VTLAVARIDGLADEAHRRVAGVAARHERTLLRVARQASLCHDDALDAYQRALEIFVRRVATVDPATEVAWLKVVVRHEAMAIRRARSEAVADGELDLDAFVPGPERSVEDQIASGERVRRSAEALRALKADEAKALMMKAHGLSYEEIGERNGWSYTKVNRAITEGRRRFIKAYEGIESGEECERFVPIVQALSTGSATAAQVLEIRPHLRHCTACRATVRELHVSRLRRASLFWPIFIVAEPLGRVAGLRHEVTALFHRAQASDLATGAGLAGSGGGGRIATVGAVLGLCLGGATAGTVCVVTGALPDLSSKPPARQDVRPEREKRAEKPPETNSRAPSPPAVTTASLRSPPRATPTATPSRPKRPAKAVSARRRKREAKEAAPREFGFENQAPSAPTRTASAFSAEATEPLPQAPPPKTTSKKFSPAEQEFAP